jgi:hypothetical protein
MAGFDAVTAFMSLMDVADPERTMLKVARDRPVLPHCPRPKAVTPNHCARIVRHAAVADTSAVTA